MADRDISTTTPILDTPRRLRRRLEYIRDHPLDTSSEIAAIQDLHQRQQELARVTIGLVKRMLETE